MTMVGSIYQALQYPGIPNGRWRLRVRHREVEWVRRMDQALVFCVGEKTSLPVPR